MSIKTRSRPLDMHDTTMIAWKRVKIVRNFPKSRDLILFGRFGRQKKCTEIAGGFQAF